MNPQLWTSKLFFEASKCFTVHVQPSRSSIVFRRMFPVALYAKERTGPFRPKLKRREYVYIMEENTNTQPAGNMDVILATDIQGLGLKGDIVNVGKVLARTHMLPVGVADYVSPENMEKYKKIREENVGKPRQTMTAMRTVKQLAGMCLPIPMSSTSPWQLSKTHVKVSFRMAGVELADECIKLPEELITKPGEIKVQVTLNGMNTVMVKAIVYHYNPHIATALPPIWSADTNKTRFDIEEVIANAARMMRGMTVDEKESSTPIDTGVPVYRRMRQESPYRNAK